MHPTHPSRSMQTGNSEGKADRGGQIMGTQEHTALEVS
jgi:hypothetical protein